jgi:hypothetical protein
MKEQETNSRALIHSLNWSASDPKRKRSSHRSVGARTVAYWRSSLSHALLSSGVSWPVGDAATTPQWFGVEPLGKDRLSPHRSPWTLSRA